MIEFNHITKSFKKDFWSKKFTALEDVSFEIKKGSLVGFLGHNGAGKTTCIKILFKFIKPDKGEVVFGDGVTGFSDFLSRVGYLPERPYFYPYLTGREFAKYMAEVNKVEKSSFEENLSKYATKFKIDFALDREIRGYSKGMLQRLGLVTSLIHDPDILVLDEPVAGMDPLGRKEIKDTLVELNGQGKTIFVCSHIVSDIEEICSDVIVLDRGKLLYSGGVEELLNLNDKKDFMFKLPREVECEELGDSRCIFQSQTTQGYLIPREEIHKAIEFIKSKDIIDFELYQSRPTLEEVVYKLGRSS